MVYMASAKFISLLNYRIIKLQAWYPWITIFTSRKYL